MFKIDTNNVITITRGDNASFSLVMQDPNTGVIYVPQLGDVVRFSVKRKLTDTVSMFYVILNDKNEFVLSQGMTKNQPFGEYFYDVELTFASGDVNTVIAPDCSSGVPMPNFIISCEVHKNAQ
ncbi:MAG: hypothetical protein RR313_09800 [Anaerovoracaceae bacterium]